MCVYVCLQPEIVDRVQKTDLTAKVKRAAATNDVSLEKGNAYWSLIVITLITLNPRSVSLSLFTSHLQFVRRAPSQRDFRNTFRC